MAPPLLTCTTDFGMTSSIPVYVLAFNNPTYVRAMVDALLESVTDDVRIVDNCSTSATMLGYLAGIADFSRGRVRVIRLETNTNPSILPRTLEGTPDRFAFTDPDLLFNPAMPAGSLQFLSEVADRHRADKVGLALDISEPDLLIPDPTYVSRYTILNWEQSHFWHLPLGDPSGIPMFNASIDTTFALYTKQFTPSLHIRVAGPYTCKHLPWYLPGREPPGCPLPTLEEWDAYSRAGAFSTTARILMPLLRQAHLPMFRADVRVHGADMVLFYEGTNAANHAFFRDTSSKTWRRERFAVLDRFLGPGKLFVDVGAWLGPQTVYAARAVKARVVALEPDPAALRALDMAVLTNDCTQVFVIPKAVGVDAGGARVVPNPHLPGAVFGDPGSVVTYGGVAGVPTACISVSELEAMGLFQAAALIKIDINGGEQDVLTDLLAKCFQHRVPLYVVFHVPWWTSRGPTLDSIISTATHLYPYIPLGQILLGDPCAGVLFV